MMTHAPLQRNTASRFTRGSVLLIALILSAACVMTPDKPEDFSSPAFSMVQIAGQLQAKGDLAGAADFYQRALQRDPKDVVARKGLAAILEKTGNLIGASEQYREALKAKPRDAELLRGYGRTLIALDKPAEARDEYKAALDIDDDDAKAHNGLGVALDYLGDHKAAQKEFEEALQLDKDDLATINNLAYSYILTRDYDKAIKLLEPEQNNPKATPALRQNLALAYGLAGMDADAERMAKIDLPPKKVKANLAYYKQQRAELAVTTAPYAEVGTYATEALAEAQIAKLQPQLDRAGSGLKPVIKPEVASPGGTPRFTVRMLGCAKPDEVKNFCDYLAEKGLPCVAHGGAGESPK